MPWFQRLCRQTGLAIHHATKPAQKEAEEPKMVMRRTTIIEEVEIPASEAPPGSASLIHREHGGTEARSRAEGQESRASPP